MAHMNDESRQDVSVCVWVCGTEPSAGATFVSLATDKAWDGGMVEDYTSNHDFGCSRSTGVLRGWALALTPAGSWTWNVGDGKTRLDYRPTPARQPITDGDWHLLAFTVERSRQEGRLYYDGSCVAVYSLTGLGSCLAETGRADPGGESCFAEGLVVEPGVVWPPSKIADIWQHRRAGEGRQIVDDMAADRVGEIRVLAWNIWHGGRRDGDVAGLETTISAIRASGADVVLMQETYGSGANIADGLEYHFYLRSSNLAIFSRFPIRATHDLFRPFNFGGVTLELSPGQQLRVFSTWLHYLPDYAGSMKGDEAVSTSALLQAEAETRADEAERLLVELAPMLTESAEIPVIVAGDFNSPSHLDWRQDTASRHRGLVVDWPVSLAMEQAGFVDTYRTIHGSALATSGFTWSPRFEDAWKDRIDFIYTHGEMTPLTAAVVDAHPPRWPSDHGAVSATLRLN